MLAVDAQWVAPAFYKGLEGPKFSVLKKGDGWELRRYEPGTHSCQQATRTVTFHRVGPHIPHNVPAMPACMADLSVCCLQRHGYRQNARQWTLIWR